MNDDIFNRLQKTVLAAVREAKPQSTQSRAKVFGLFVDEALKNRHLSREAFAAKLNMERELVDAILDGVLPESELNDDLLAEIAPVIGYQTSDLQMLLGRAPKTDGAAHG